MAEIEGRQRPSPSPFLQHHTSFARIIPRRNLSTHHGFASKCKSALDGLAAEENGSGARGVPPNVARKAAADHAAGLEDPSCADDRNRASLPPQPSKQGQGQVRQLVSGFLAQ